MSYIFFSWLLQQVDSLCFYTLGNYLQSRISLRLTMCCVQGKIHHPYFLYAHLDYKVP